MARVLVKKAKPSTIAQEVAGLFGKHLPTVEKATLIRRGRPLASTYRKR